MKLTWVLAWLTAGCTTMLPGAMPHDLRFDATKLAQDRCDTTSVDPRVYSSETVLHVTPYTRHVMGGPSGMEAHLAGAQLELRPLPGVTAELLQRGLECRSAELLLGRAVPAPNEPYVLPGGWVRIDVKSGGGSFLVTVAAEDPARTHEVLARAQAFVGRAPAVE